MTRPITNREPPTIVLVGGKLILEDGSELDSRQAMNDAATGRAVHKSLVGSAGWWSAVVSVVVPTLDDDEGGFALADQLTIARVTADGRLGRVRFPRYPRASGAEDYIYNSRTLDAARTAVKRTRKQEPTAHRSPRIRIDTTGTVVRTIRDDRAAFRGTRLLVVPDTRTMRELIGVLLGVGGSVVEATEQNPWEDPYRYLRLPIRRAECSITGLVLGGEWRDPSALEAARRLLLERFDLKVGLWDLALNPVLRSTALDPSPSPRVSEKPAEVPAVVRRRAEQEAGGVERLLFKGVAATGWKLTRFGLQHAVAKNAGRRRSEQHEYPYLRLFVGPHSVRVLAWHWDYNRFDINAFVDARSKEFDAVALLPTRRPIAAWSVRILAKMKKRGDVVYRAGRRLDDTRWVLLWSAPKGWADLDGDWSAIAKEVARRTPAWVTLLADAVAMSLDIERTTLRLVHGAEA